MTGESLQLLPPSRRLSQGITGGWCAPGESAGARRPILPVIPQRSPTGSVTITIIHRGDRYGLRIKDSKAAARVQFHGLKWYAPNEAYRVHCQVDSLQSRRIRSPVPTILGTEVMSDVPGVAEFTLDGKTYRLEPILESPDDKDLFFILRDTTSKSETYGAGRFLYTPLPDHGLTQPGEVVLDFNRAENPPCAYTPYATCPLPPPQNRLPIAIPAGQQRYHD